MAYKMENEELHIASCSIADLTLEQAQEFLWLWEEKATLGTLTLFFDKKTGLVVLNRDNEHYQAYLDITEGYLSANKEQRKELRKEAPKSMSETLVVLEKCIQDRVANKWIFRAEKNSMKPFERKMVERVLERHDPIVAAYVSFKIGVMRGKRIERAKKKR